MFLREIRFLRWSVILGVVSLPFLFKKQPVKDWILVFFIKGLYSGFVNSFMIGHKKITYPVRLLPKIFKIHVVFDLLLFPIACVLYNQMTYRSTLKEIVGKVFIFSVPMSIVEHWAEKNTKLIKYHKGWNGFYSFASLTLSFLLVRGTMALIRKFDNTAVKNMEKNRCV